jgi:flagellar motor switch protein FliN/FliY
MSDSLHQSDVDVLMQQLQASNDLAAQAAQAIEGAVHSAEEIAAALPDPSKGTGGTTLGPVNSAPAPGNPFPGPIQEELRRLLAIEVPVIVQLGARRLTVGEVMRFSAGAIIEFNKSADEELDLLVSNKPIGKGHAVKVGENFGIKISAIGPVKETIRKLGGL